MTYNELLLQKEWFNKCRDILQRDQYHCKNCGCLGYHNNTYYECQTAEELDSLLKGLLIKGDSPSAFLNKINENTCVLNHKVYEHEKDEIANRQIIGDRILTDLQIASYLLPIAPKNRINENRCKYYSLYNQDVTLSQATDWVFQKGCFCIFENKYFENYVLRIEKRWLVFGSAIQCGWKMIVDTGLEEKIVISICFHNYCISLYFDDSPQFPYDDKQRYSGKTPDLSSKALFVHHKYYVKGLKPWECENEALVTLCQKCHKQEHQSNSTPVYWSPFTKQLVGTAQICDKCGGSGYLPKEDVEGDVCDKCYGEGVFFPLFSI